MWPHPAYLCHAGKLFGVLTNGLERPRGAKTHVHNYVCDSLVVIWRQKKSPFLPRPFGASPFWFAPLKSILRDPLVHSSLQLPTFLDVERATSPEQLDSAHKCGKNENMRDLQELTYPKMVSTWGRKTKNMGLLESCANKLKESENIVTFCFNWYPFGSSADQLL